MLKYTLLVRELKSERTCTVDVTASDIAEVGRYFWDVVQYELRSKDFISASFDVIDISSVEAVDYVWSDEIPENFVPDISVVPFDDIEEMLNYLADLPVSSEVDEAIERVVG